MMQYIDSISLAGWGHLLKSLLPTSGWLLLWDVVLFVLVPVLLAWALVFWQRKAFKVGVHGAWRSAGSAWCVCFWLSLVAMLGVYYAASEVLQFSRSGVTSFVTKYHQSLPGGMDGIDGVVESVKNTAVQEGEAEADVKETEDQTPRYVVVRVFWEYYPYIHPFCLTLLDMFLLGWFFFPGFAMKTKKAEIKL